MAEEPGYGFGFEALWVVDKLLDVLAGKSARVRFESDKDLNGVEAVVEGFDGDEDWLQVKHRSDGVSWTIPQLLKHVSGEVQQSVLGSALSALRAQARSFEFCHDYLAADLTKLTRSASRPGQDLAGFVAEIGKNKKSMSAFEAACAGLAIDRSEGFRLFRLVRVRHFSADGLSQLLSARVPFEIQNASPVDVIASLVAGLQKGSFGSAEVRALLPGGAEAALAAQARADSDLRSLARLRAAAVPENLLTDVRAVLDIQTQDRYDLIESQELLLVIGTRGSGKSSLVDFGFRRALDESRHAKFLDNRHGDLMSGIIDAGKSDVTDELYLDDLDKQTDEQFVQTLALGTELVRSGRLKRFWACSSRSPNTNIDGVELWQYPSLCDSEVTAIFKAVSAIQYPYSEASRLPTPLMAVLAAVVGTSERPAKTSRVELLRRLVDATRRPHDEDVFEHLVSIAETRMRTGEACLLDEPDALRLRRSNLIDVLQNRRAEFVLPLVEQYYASVAISRRPESVSEWITEPGRLKLWLDALLLAFNDVEWSVVWTVLEALFSVNPAVAVELMAELDAGDVGARISPRTSENSAWIAEQIHRTTSLMWEKLGDFRVLISPLEGGKLPAVGVGLCDCCDLVAFGIDVGAPASQSTSEVEPHDAGVPGWWFRNRQHIKALRATWILGRALEITQRLATAALKRSLVPIALTDPLWPERRYAIASALVEESRVTRPDVMAEKVTKTLDAVLSGNSTNRGSLLVNWRSALDINLITDFKLPFSELRKLRDEIRGGLEVICWPWSEPDQLESSGGWLWGIRSADNWAGLTFDLHMSAMSAYRNMAQQLGSFSHYLALWNMEPVQVEICLEVRAEPDSPPGYAGVTTRFRPTTTAEHPVLVHRENDGRAWFSSSGQPRAWIEQDRNIMESRNQGSSYYSRIGEVSSGEAPGLSVHPAYDLAVSWLLDDLRRLGLVERR